MRSPPRSYRLPLALALALTLTSGCQKGEKNFDISRLALPETSTSEGSRDDVRALYSGHSLSEGLISVVEQIASSHGEHFWAQEHNRPGSTAKERLHAEWPPAVRTAAALDALLVTERHDLLYTLLFEDTLPSLLAIHARLEPASPNVQLLLYHSWLEIDFDAPEQFVDYERHALVLWECTVSAFNRERLASKRPANAQVLPAGWALAALVEHVKEGALPELSLDPNAGVRMLFRDNVHPSAVGRYYLGALNYSFLFRKTPEGTPAPPGLRPKLARKLQQFAWQQALAYAPRAKAAGMRRAELCRDYAAQVMTKRFVDHPRDGEATLALRRWKQRYDFRSAFSDPNASNNPFR